VYEEKHFILKLKVYFIYLMSIFLTCRKDEFLEEENEDAGSNRDIFLLQRLQNTGLR
jgi:hypothetical protein